MKAVALPETITGWNQSWFFRYKLHHLPFWFGYHFMWWTLRMGSPMAVVGSLALPHAAVKFLFYMIFQMVGVYFNLYFLIPRFLEKGRYIIYILLLLATIITSASLVVMGYYFGDFISEKTFKELYGMDPNFFGLFESGALPSTVAAMTLAMSIKLTKNWIQARQREKLMEKEKLETELKFLKSQMNPHFLFNTINSIFVLIHKNPIMASESLARFSDLLRYQLYECNEQHISLTQELGYLHNFIELQQLRHDHNQISLQMHIDESAPSDLVIAPFVLIPFIENAFKHVSRTPSQPNWIQMNIHIENEQLHFTITNSVPVVPYMTTDAIKHSGIGLQNVKRRLTLTYPGTHSLNIMKNSDHFEVKLVLTLQRSADDKRLVIPA